MRTLLACLVMSLELSACGGPPEPPSTRPSLPDSAPAAAPVAVAPRPVALAAKVVFLDKENACECTTKRITDTWAALEAALGTPPRLPVQRLHADTDEALASAYTSVKPMMVAPAIYLVDARDAVLAQLQGDVTAAQITAELEKVAPPPNGPGR